MRNILYFALGLFLGTAVVLNTAQAQESLDDLLFPERKLLNDPNFPMSQDEVNQFWDEIRKNVTDLQPASGLQVEFKDANGIIMGLNVYDERTNKITMNKALGTLFLGKVATSEKERQKFQTHLKAIMGHEYGHALLQPLLMQQSNVVEVLARFHKAQDEKTLTVDEMDLIRQWYVFLSYHEIFGDIVASLYSKNPKAIPEAVKYAFGSDMSLFEKTPWRRGFVAADIDKKEKTFLKKFGNTLLGDEVTSYHVFTPIRAQIYEMLLSFQGNERIQTVNRLAQALAEEANLQLSKEAKELTIAQMNSSLQKRLQQVLSN